MKRELLVYTVGLLWTAVVVVLLLKGHTESVVVAAVSFNVALLLVKLGGVS